MGAAVPRRATDTLRASRGNEAGSRRETYDDGATSVDQEGSGAGDGIRTRDILLGKQAVRGICLDPILTIRRPYRTPGAKVNVVRP